MSLAVILNIGHIISSYVHLDKNRNVGRCWEIKVVKTVV